MRVVVAVANGEALALSNVPLGIEARRLALHPAHQIGLAAVIEVRRLWEHGHRILIVVAVVEPKRIAIKRRIGVRKESMIDVGVEQFIELATERFDEIEVRLVCHDINV